MKEKISVRQICFILIAYNAVTKLIVYPNEIAQICGNALLFPAALNVLLQTAVVWSIAYLSSKTDKTFFRLIEDSLGRVVSRIVAGLFALYFLAFTVLPMVEQELFVHEIFYDTIPALIVFLPFFFFSVYAGAKDLTNTGRAADVCLPIFAVTALCLFVMSVTEADFSNLLPVLKLPFAKLANGTSSGIFRFSESAFLLMFMGHYKYRKGDGAKITLSYFLGGLITLLFLAVYYGIYGELAANQPFAIAKLSIFFPAIDYIGRIDLIALYALDVVTLFAIVLSVQMCVHCLKIATGYPNAAVWSLAVNAVLLVSIFVLDHKFTLVGAAFSGWFWIATLVFAYAFPVCGWALRRKKK